MQVEELICKHKHPQTALPKKSVSLKSWPMAAETCPAISFWCSRAPISPFYTDAPGLNVTQGTLIMISRLFDGVTDVIMGYVMDKTNALKHGKARAWMLWLAVAWLRP